MQGSNQQPSPLSVPRVARDGRFEKTCWSGKLAGCGDVLFFSPQHYIYTLEFRVIASFFFSILSVMDGSVALFFRWFL